MTIESVAPPLEGREPETEARKALACAFCKRRLADEYYFTCRKCDLSYCYVHMSRHLPTRCGRRVLVKPPRSLLVAEAGRGRSSANV